MIIDPIDMYLLRFMECCGIMGNSQDIFSLPNFCFSSWLRGFLKIIQKNFVYMLAGTEKGPIFAPA